MFETVFLGGIDLIKYTKTVLINQEKLRRQLELIFRGYVPNLNGGETEIRTQEVLANPTLFESVPFSHSGISPIYLFNAFRPSLPQKLKFVLEKTGAVPAFSE